MCTLLKRKTMAEPLFPLLRLLRHRMGTDGFGITTLAAGAGCPLRWRWCINKRILTEATPEMLDAHDFLNRVLIDDLYFRATGGGVTFGGGESLLHAEFICRFKEICPPEWKITAETSLAVPIELLKLSLYAVDEFIVDCKDMNREIYHRYTGGDGFLMYSNLSFLLEKAGAERVLIRVPAIPYYNTEEDRKTSVKILQKMGAVRLDLFDYIIREEMKSETFSL